ncbi:MAG: SMP-30/gluconolactonase/LRE family protein, partial [Candidatus Latescibacterota bacterium]
RILNMGKQYIRPLSPLILLSLLFSCMAYGDDAPRFLPYQADFRRIFPDRPEVKIVVDSERDGKPLRMTEGPSWLGGALYFSDQPGGLHSLRPDGKWSLINHEGWTCGTAPLKNGNLAVCYVESTTVVEMNPGGVIIRTLIDKVDGAKLFGNPNDIAADSRGGLYVTITPFFGKDAPRNTAVIYRKPSGETIMVARKNEYGFPNGCCLSPDERIFYLNDGGSFTVWAYDVMADGGLGNKRAFAELKAPPDADEKERNAKSSAADGMDCDRAGNIYVTSRFGLHVFSGDGAALGLVKFDAQPSNCTFGGEDMKTLFVTCRTKVYAIRTLTGG